MPTLFEQSILAGEDGPAGVRSVWPPDLGDSRDDIPRYAQAADGLVSHDVLGYNPKERG
jgi:hypothetical protein